MGKDSPFIMKPSVESTIRDNGNLTALAQFGLLTVVPGTILVAAYFMIRSGLTASSLYNGLTVLGLLFTLALYAVLIKWRVVRWFNVPVDDFRRPQVTQFVGNLLMNSWPLLPLVIWQSSAVTPLSIGLKDDAVTVVAFIYLACAVFAAIPFSMRMIREMLEPLFGNSIELAVRDRELKSEERRAKNEAKKAQASVEYAQQLESKVAQLAAELDKAKRGSRVIFANHGSARGDSNLAIDDNQMFNRFVVAAFSGEQRTRDEWSKWLIANPLTETVTDGRQRYLNFRNVLVAAGLWNMKSGPLKTLEEACKSIGIPLPHRGNDPAGGRAGVQSALATAPDFESRAGGSDAMTNDQSTINNDDEDGEE